MMIHHVIVTDANNHESPVLFIESFKDPQDAAKVYTQKCREEGIPFDQMDPYVSQSQKGAVTILLTCCKLFDVKERADDQKINLMVIYPDSRYPHYDEKIEEIAGKYGGEPMKDLYRLEEGDRVMYFEIFELNSINFSDELYEKFDDEVDTESEG